MKFDDTLIASKNLLTCCVYTLLDMADNDGERDVGDGLEVTCTYSGRNRDHKMLLLNGTWRWINPRMVEAEQRERLRLKGGLRVHK